jgi:hypothetical protein
MRRAGEWVKEACDTLGTVKGAKVHVPSSNQGNAATTPCPISCVTC